MYKIIKLPARQSTLVFHSHSISCRTTAWAVREPKVLVLESDALLQDVMELLSWDL